MSTQLNKLPKAAWPAGSIPMRFTAPRELYADLTTELQIQEYMGRGGDMHNMLVDLLNEALSARRKATLRQKENASA